MFGFGKKRVSSQETRSLAFSIFTTICLAVLLVTKKLSHAQNFFLIDYSRKILGNERSEENHQVIAHDLTDRLAELNRILDISAYEGIMRYGRELPTVVKKELLTEAFRFIGLYGTDKTYVDLAFIAAHCMELTQREVSPLITEACAGIEWRYENYYFSDQVKSLEIMELALSRVDFPPSKLGF